MSESSRLPYPELAPVGYAALAGVELAALAGIEAITDIQHGHASDAANDDGSEVSVYWGAP